MNDLVVSEEMSRGQSNEFINNLVAAGLTSTLSQMIRLPHDSTKKIAESIDLEVRKVAAERLRNWRRFATLDSRLLPD